MTGPQTHTILQKASFDTFRNLSKIRSDLTQERKERLPTLEPKVEPSGAGTKKTTRLIRPVQRLKKKRAPYRLVWSHLGLELRPAASFSSRVPGPETESRGEEK